MSGVLSPFSGARVALVDAVITTGSVTCTNSPATWVQVGSFEIDIPAVVGNRVAIGINAMRSGSDAIDVAVIVGSSFVRYMSTRTSTPASDGDNGWYASGGGPFYSNNVPRFFTVTANDLDGANVRFQLVSKGSGTSQILAATTDPFYWQALNFGS